MDNKQDITMDFFSEKINEINEKKSILIPRRSIYILKDDARYKWKHGIPGRKYDMIDNMKIARNTRVSITFRNVIKNKVKYENK